MSACRSPSFGWNGHIRCAVVEVGTNHPGEIQYLCAILRPTHGLITNIGREHLEFFGSPEGVAEEERILVGCERMHPA